ncbi:hypothetical protein E1211_05400 [Micromonospora sp. 15K316]|uniref:hypothetical protein n=1 Tax=Micromonospora sp. 15K316 TaxID=2530376 RepID=UPI001053F5F2|nr:hypothetical protein [Micromonospora sp. 15K316]TDC39102.1 hypothetical protein E1211_05400 [Micromonospora sp. 15K316]
MTQRTRTAGLPRRAAVASAALAVAALSAGCVPGADRAAEPDASSAAPTAKEALLAAVPDGTEGTFRFSGKDSSSTISGLVDPAGKGTEISTAVKDADLGFTTTISFRIVTEQTWMKVKFSNTKGLTGFPKLPDRWLRLDRERIADAESAPVYEGADVGNAGPLIEAATKVEEQAGGRYAGTIDLTSGEAAKVLAEEEMAALGAKAAAVPFTAQVGPDGNLASFTMRVPAAGAQKAYEYLVQYRDYGSAPKVTAPAGSAAQDAPTAAYELLNG